MHDEAWADLHEATPPGWYVGRASLHDERAEWVMYAFDPSERPVMGHRKREWTAIAQTENAVVARDGALPARHRPGQSAEVMWSSH